MRLLHIATAMTSVGLLAACGGSPGDSPAPAPAPGTPASITLTGVVATGAALADAAVSAKCATGTGTATSSSTGSYTLSITGGALPCVLEATSSDAATMLHSVATATAGSTEATANITPLTELLVAQMTGQDPADYMAGVSASALSVSVTASAVTTAQTALLTMLTAAGLDTAAIGNMVSDPLVAASGGTAGNAHDLVLDSLAATLATAGTTLPEFSATVASSSPNAGTPQGNASMLPPELLASPKAASCDALRSTSYRILKISPSVTTDDSDPVTATQTMTFDATTLTANFGPGDDWVWTATDQRCQYTAADGTEIVVSPSGVIVARAFIGADDDTVSLGNRYRMLLGMPSQTIPVAQLEGTWNMLGWDIEDSGLHAPNAGITSINASGQITNSRCFGDALNTVEASCTIDATPQPVFTAHEGGGFNVISTDSSDPWSLRAFVYKAGNGEKMMVWLNAQGELSFSTRQRVAPLPTQGNVSTGWNVQLNAGNTAADVLSTTTNTISSINGNTVTRQSQSNGSSVSVPQQMVFNSPRDGMTRRLPETVTASDGSSATVRELYSIRLTGFGMSAYALPSTLALPSSNARFGVSVELP
jgi:hypothetical protein